MTTREKVLGYLRTHKTPATVQSLTERFMLSITGVRNALIELEDQQLVVSTVVGRRQFWSAARYRTVAVSQPVDQAERPAAVVPTSYPHVRGYDD